MRFGRFDLNDAEGVRLAHTLRHQGRLLCKGHVLSVADIAWLRDKGLHEVWGARLQDDELDENEAVRQAAEQLSAANITAQHASHGRCNLKASKAGLLRVNSTLVQQLNRLDGALTVATLPPYASVRERQVVATLKTIPFAVAKRTLDRWREVLQTSADDHAINPVLGLAVYHPCRVALLLTTTATTQERLLLTTTAVTRARLSAYGVSGIQLVWERRCAHDSAAVAQSLRSLQEQGAEMILIVGDTVSKDAGDTIPAALVAAGGRVVHFGMPVEPGNMLLFGRLGTIPVVQLPGCARSGRLNGFDWVLRRLLAGLDINPYDIMDMGAGGLLASAAEEPDHEEGRVSTTLQAAREPRVAALVLAAGRAARMGGEHKLLRAVDGEPMVRHAVRAALGSRCVQTMVVTGFDAVAIEATLHGLPISLVCNAEAATGMASSLRCGLRALPADLDAVVVLLADMPRLRSDHINQLLAAFDAQAPAIVAPVWQGRRGNPVLWPKRCFEAMMQLQGDQGARQLIDLEGGDVVTVAIADEAIFTDVDTEADLHALRHERSISVTPVT